jgi:hypothetical protein
MARLKQVLLVPRGQIPIVGLIDLPLLHPLLLFDELPNLLALDGLAVGLLRAGQPHLVIGQAVPAVPRGTRGQAAPQEGHFFFVADLGGGQLVLGQVYYLRRTQALPTVAQSEGGSRGLPTEEGRRGVGALIRLLQPLNELEIARFDLGVAGHLELELLILFLLEDGDGYFRDVTTRTDPAHRVGILGAPKVRGKLSHGPGLFLQPELLLGLRLNQLSLLVDGVLDLGLLYLQI